MSTLYWFVCLSVGANVPCIAKSAKLNVASEVAAGSRFTNTRFNGRGMDGSLRHTPSHTYTQQCCKFSFCQQFQLAPQLAAIVCCGYFGVMCDSPNLNSATTPTDPNHTSYKANNPKP